MIGPPHKRPITTLSDACFEECLKLALIYLKNNASIRNQDLRQISGISYDQAIRFFNRAISEDRLVRQGSGSGTSYVLPQRKDKSIVRK